MIQRLAHTELSSITRPLSLALGVFDGIHLGHQAVMEKAIAHAEKEEGLAGVLTFDPHPIQVLAPERAPQRLLASLEHKETILSELGMDLLIIVSFDRKFASLEPNSFLEELRQASQLKSLSMGIDWKFGKGRKGNSELLRKFGHTHGIAIEPIEAVMMDGERISSTRIRQALRDGNLAAANQMLGRPYSVLGTVQKGKQLGRQLGFPTANIIPTDEQLPPNGVWAVEARWAKDWYPAVANLGRRPTVGGEEDKLLEVHLLDWSGDLYGKNLEVRFSHYLRKEQKFDNIEALKEQIQKDSNAARALSKS